MVMDRRSAEVAPKPGFCGRVGSGTVTSVNRDRKPPPVGLLLAMVAVGAGLAGYLVGRWEGADELPARPASPRRVAAVDPWDEVFGDEDNGGVGLEEAEPGSEAVAAEPDPSESGKPLTMSERLVALKRAGDSPRSQKMLLGLVADAASRGAAALPDLKALLDEGRDIKFAAYDGKSPGYPSLRVALLAAAEATGDPAAAALIHDVAATSESPVEVVFSAHLLDRLDSLDAATAQRTFEALSGNLSAEEKKAMAAVVGKVVPAAAKADPAYAEHFIVTQLRITEGPRADPRLVVPALTGLPAARARAIVFDSVVATDVSDRTKRMLASRAAQHGDTKMLTDLRTAIESNAVSPKVSAAVARSAMSGSIYGQMERSAWKALKAGDLKEATQAARNIEMRLNEARLTVNAALNTGAKVPAEINKRESIYRERLMRVKNRIHAEARKLENQAGGG